MENIRKSYEEMVNQYISNQNEVDLYSGQKLSRQFIEKEVSPEEVIGIHKDTLQSLLPDLSEEITHSFDFLLEVMIHYGLALQEHQSLIRKQEEYEMEMNIAAKVQGTLLKTKVPNYKGLDIGFVSVPAKQMSGDYAYFVSDEKSYASVAVADVIGKGIPAALCMSMIKFGMDSMPADRSSPQLILDIVNRIVEESVDDSMFISMFYGTYTESDSLFSYASAGHEPVLLYKASEDKFIELDAQGLLLGVQPDATYEQRSVKLEDGDFVAVMTDGVTEVRTDEGFIDEKLIKELLRTVRNENSQAIAETVYQNLLELQNFHLQDDFTIIIFKKEKKEV